MHIKLFDYPSFDMQMPLRTYTANNSTYRYGINRQEKSNELNSDGNLYNAEYWEYDSRIGRRWNPDPVINISESRYLCYGNNPIYYLDPLCDFKSRFSAKVYALFHGGKVNRQAENTGSRSGEWRVSKKSEYNGYGDGVAVKVIYGWDESENAPVPDAVRNWWNSVELTSQTNFELNVGIQAGANIRINSLINAKVEAGYAVNKLIDAKADALHMENAKINFGFETDEEGRFYLQKNYVNIGVEAGIPKTPFTGNIGYEYNQTEKYYSGYYGNRSVDFETSSGWNGNIKLTPFKSKPSEITLTNSLSGKVGVNTEKKFYGLDVSAAAKIVFGVKIQFKIGFQQK